MELDAGLLLFFSLAIDFKFNVPLNLEPLLLLDTLEGIVEGCELNLLFSKNL